MGRAQCEEGECEIDTFRNIQADFGMTGSYRFLEGKHRVTLKLFDVKRGSLLGTKSIIKSRQIELLDAVERESQKLAKECLPKSTDQPPATSSALDSTLEHGGDTESPNQGARATTGDTAEATPNRLTSEKVVHPRLDAPELQAAVVFPACKSRQSEARMLLRAVMAAQEGYRKAHHSYSNLEGLAAEGHLPQDVLAQSRYYSITVTATIDGYSARALDTRQPVNPLKQPGADRWIASSTAKSPSQESDACVKPRLPLSSSVLGSGARLVDQCLEVMSIGVKAKSCDAAKSQVARLKQTPDSKLLETRRISAQLTSAEKKAMEAICLVMIQDQMNPASWVKSERVKGNETGWERYHCRSVGVSIGGSSLGGLM
jgi:type II secretory pathway pseudopilin PulG